MYQIVGILHLLAPLYGEELDYVMFALLFITHQCFSYQLIFLQTTLFSDTETCSLSLYPLCIVLSLLTILCIPNVIVTV